MTKKIYKLRDLLEGVYDKFIFKAVFVTGSPAAGKTTTAQRIVKEHYGMKIIDSDPQFELLAQKAGLQLGDMDLHTENQKLHTATLRNIAKTMREKDLTLKNEGALGVVIPTNIDDAEGLLRKKKALEDKGYDTFLIYINIPLEEAIKRNQQRERSVYTEVVIDTWRKAQEEISAVSPYFHGYTLVLDGRTDVQGHDLEPLDRFLNAKIRNPIAHDWLQLQLMLKNRLEPENPEIQ